jgi:hypothetical protein
VSDDEDKHEASNAFDNDPETKWRTCEDKVGKWVSFNVATESITKVCFKQPSGNPIPKWLVKYRPDATADFETLYTADLENGGSGYNCVKHSTHSEAQPERCPNTILITSMKPVKYDIDKNVGFPMDRHLQNSIRLDTTMVDWSRGSFTIAFKANLDMPENHEDTCKELFECYCRFFTANPADDVTDESDGAMFVDGKPWTSGQKAQWRSFQLFDEGYDRLENRSSADVSFWDTDGEHTWIFMVDQSQSPHRLRMFKDGVEASYQHSVGVATQILGDTFNPGLFEIPSRRYSPWGTLSWVAMWRGALGAPAIEKMSDPHGFHAHMHLSPLQPLWHMVFKIPLPPAAPPPPTSLLNRTQRV